MKYIKNEEYCGRPVVSVDLDKDFLLPPERKDPRGAGRGALKNCRGAKRIVPVWADFGWADCSVEWLRQRGCPIKYFIHDRKNDRC